MTVLGFNSTNVLSIRCFVMVFVSVLLSFSGYSAPIRVQNYTFLLKIKLFKPCILRIFMFF